jgi:hypothetical protein
MQARTPAAIHDAPLDDLDGRRRLDLPLVSAAATIVGAAHAASGKDALEPHEQGVVAEGTDRQRGTQIQLNG